jgi:hypothetical protein
MPGVSPNDGFERPARAVHEVGVVAAVDVEIDESGADEVTSRVERRSRPCAQLVLRPERPDSSVGDVDGSARNEAVRKNQRRVDDSDTWHRSSPELSDYELMLQRGDQVPHFEVRAVARRAVQIMYVTEASQVGELPTSSDLLDWLDYVERRCPECEGGSR